MLCRLDFTHGHDYLQAHIFPYATIDVNPQHRKTHDNRGYYLIDCPTKRSVSEELPTSAYIYEEGLIPYPDYQGVFCAL